MRVLRITDAKDPDEYIRKFGTDAFARLLKGSSTGFSYRLDGVLNRYNIKEPEDRIKAAAELCGMVARVWSSAEREVYLQAVSERLGLPIDSLRRDVERAQARIQRDRHQSEARAARMSALALDDRVNPEAAGNIRAAAAEDTVLGLMLLYEEHRRAVREGAVSLTADDFVTAFNRRVFEAIMELENSDGGFSTAVLGEKFDPDEMGRLAKLAQARRNLSENGQSVLKAAVRTLQDEKNAVTKDDAPPEDSLERLLEKKRQKMHKSNG